MPVEVEADDAAGEAARRALGERLAGFRHQFEAPGVELGARYDGSPIVWPDGAPPDDDLLVYRPSSVPGGRLPHVWVTAADGARRSVFDLLGAGFTLLRVRARGTAAGRDDDGAARLADAARARRLPLSIVDVESDAARALYARQLVLVRPDQHVAWRGDAAPRDAGAVLDRAVGRI